MPAARTRVRGTASLGVIEVLEGCTPSDSFAKIIGGDSEATARDLKRPIGPYPDSKTGHPIAADQTHLDAALAIAIGDDGNNPAVGKIDVLDHLVGHFHLLAHWKVDRNQICLEQCEVLDEKSRQNSIGVAGKILSGMALSGFGLERTASLTRLRPNAGKRCLNLPSRFAR
jgi:hypothetical protein